MAQSSRDPIQIYQFLWNGERAIWDRETDDRPIGSPPVRPNQILVSLVEGIEP